LGAKEYAGGADEVSGPPQRLLQIALYVTQTESKSALPLAFRDVAIVKQEEKNQEECRLCFGEKTIA
jgi:hypothetical protein